MQGLSPADRVISLVSGKCDLHFSPVIFGAQHGTPLDRVRINMLWFIIYAERASTSTAVSAVETKKRLCLTGNIVSIN